MDDLGGAAAEGFADAAQTEGGGRVHRVRPARLAHAVGLEDGHVEAAEVVDDVGRHGRGAAQQQQRPVQAQRLAHLLEHQRVGDGEAQRLRVAPVPHPPSSTTSTDFHRPLPSFTHVYLVPRTFT